MEEKKLPGCYAGKIARINLTNSTVEVIPTSNYCPEYIGGRAVCNKIFWDEVPAGVKALDPENKLIFMTGPTGATGIPTGGRSVFTGLAPNSMPEQYCWSGIGGWFGSELKFAGWDGFILEGKAPVHTYVLIEDDKIQFLPADPVWGMLVHPSQHKLEELHGKEVKSMVIGPAGENLLRNASITTSNDNVAAKAGFGAVWGAKNLKAIVVHGSGTVKPAQIDKVFELRAEMGMPYMRPNPVYLERNHGMDGNTFSVEGGWLKGQVACSHGCNQHCDRVMMDVKGAFSDERTNLVEKCVGIYAYGAKEDISWMTIQTFESDRNHMLPCKMLSCEPPPVDPDDPFAPVIFQPVRGDIVNFWDVNFDRGSIWMDMCNEYGIDKWDMIVWYFTWLSMAEQEGLLDELDFGMKVDVNSIEFVRYFMDMITYRKGKYGPIFAEGMARAIRTLGKEKFGDAVYHGRISQVTGQQYDLPVSLETAWGHCMHWQGRGFEGSITKPGWVATNLMTMNSSRDCQTIIHHHDKVENYLKLKDDPCHSEYTITGVAYGEEMGEIKDSLMCCDWQSPDLYWPDMEAKMYEAATGEKISTEELHKFAERSRLLFRAILIRNYGRDRQQEVNAIFPSMQWPDQSGQTVTWEEWNDLVDLYYDYRGYDQKTGWPTRATWEKYDLGYVADTLEKVGKVPS